MANIQLIKDILADKVTDYTIDDIFSVTELDYDYANELTMYTFDSLDLDVEEILNDQCVRDEGEMDDDEKITDEKRSSHGLYYLDEAIRYKCEEKDLISEDIHLYKAIDIDDREILVSYNVRYENHGMGGDFIYQDASLEGIFESYDELKQYYAELGYFIFNDECDEKCMDARKQYILDLWDKDSIEKETPKEKEDQLVKERILTKFQVYTTPISPVEIGKSVPETLKKYDSFVIIFALDKVVSLGSGAARMNKIDRYSHLKNQGIKMYSTTASGADFKWSKKCTRCLINVTKQEALDFIKWSDSHFGVWYDGSVPIILYV